jgi:uncharacterized protein YndB with AHSA1/START domain
MQFCEKSTFKQIITKALIEWRFCRNVECGWIFLLRIYQLVGMLTTRCRRMARNSAPRPHDDATDEASEANQSPVSSIIDSRRGEIIMATGTVRLHRVLRATPDRVYRAVLTADAVAKWLPPFGFTCTVHHLDARVGGGFRMSFHNFSSGKGHSFGGEYRELVPDARIRYSDKFDDPGLPGEMETTINLKTVLCGTEIDIVQTGIPEVIPVEMCYLGWQESLVQLAQLVEPVIPD